MTTGAHPGRVVVMHAQFEAQRPDEAQAELDYENHRQALWLRSHTSLEGYQSPREFPCPGALRVFDQSDGLLMLGCDACPYVTTVRSESDLTGATF